MTRTIAIIAPGAMGSAVARRLTDHGARVLTSLAGRSPATRGRAEASGMVDATDDQIAAAEVILSILPPGEAVALAERLAPALARAAHGPIYVDCKRHRRAHHPARGRHPRRRPGPFRGRRHHRRAARRRARRDPPSSWPAPRPRTWAGCRSSDSSSAGSTVPGRGLGQDVLRRHHQGPDRHRRRHCGSRPGRRRLSRFAGAAASQPSS